MGKFFNLFNNSFDEDPRFIEMVRANENGEEWAQEELQRLWHSNDDTLAPRVFRAFVPIYKDAAYQGDRNAILKYARGLEWCGREKEALDWYMKLINKGDTDAMLELALDYTKYGGMGEDEEEYNRWIFAAAEAGNAKALHKAGTILSLAGNKSEAKAYFEQSAEKGDPEGKAKYAECLFMDMMEISSYHQNPNQKRPDCLDDYISESDDLIPLLVSLYEKREALYLDVLNESDDDMTVSRAFSSLSSLYLNPPKGTFAPAPYHAAYFIYMDYVEFGEDASLDRFKKIVSDYDLDLYKDDLEEWESGAFVEWIQRNGIAEGEPLFVQNEEISEEKQTAERNEEGDSIGTAESQEHEAPFDLSWFDNNEDKNEDSANDNADSQEDTKLDEENKQSVSDDTCFNALLSSDNFDELLEKADAFFLGKGVEEDDSKAFVLYQRCHVLNPSNTYAMARLGQCYLNGFGVEIDTEKAYEFVAEAAKHHEALGIRTLAKMYRDGLGVPQDVQKAIQLLMSLADSGDDDAQSSLGDMFFFGEGVPVDYVEARKWYLLAAKKDNEVALDNLGLIYMNGYGVEQSVETANEYWTRASSLGSVVACFNLGLNYANGEGVEKNELKAKELFEKAVAENYSDAYYPLGLLYEDGAQGIPKDIEKAMRLFELGANAEDEDAMKHLAAIYYNNTYDLGNPKKAFQLYDSLFKKTEDSHVAFILGVMYLDGEGVTQDSEKAIHYFEIAANNGDVTAQENLGLIFLEGRGVPVDYNKSQRWYLLAAKNNSAEAINTLGYMLEQGFGAEKDIKKAFSYYYKAAELGSAIAQVNVGIAYKTGAGISKNILKAKEWFEKAASKEYARAYYQLGLLYETGSTELPQDIDKAIFWFEKGACANSEEAMAHLANIYSKNNFNRKNEKRAVELYELLFNQYSSRVAASELGFMYETGFCVEKDLKKAFEYYQQGAKWGSARCVTGLANLYYSGNGVERDVKKAFDLFILAKEHGDDVARGFLIAICSDLLAENQPYSDLAFQYMLTQAEAGDADAQYRVYHAYASGIGVEKNHNLADKWLDKAVEQEYPDALGTKGYEAYLEHDMPKCISLWEKAAPNNQKVCFDLGELYLTGDGVEKNSIKGLGLINSSAENGYFFAQRYLGILYSKGEYVEKNIAQAKEWLNKAISQDDDYARVILATIYQEEGLFDDAEKLLYKAIEKDGEWKDDALLGLAIINESYRHDYKKAFSYFLESAQLGNMVAQYYAGKCCYEANGTIKNVDEAKKWLKKSSESGFEDAKHLLDKISTEEKSKHNKFILIIIAAFLIVGIFVVSQIKPYFKESIGTTSAQTPNSTSATTTTNESSDNSSSYTAASSNIVQPDKTSSKRTAVVTAEPSLRLRTEPNTTCETLYKIPKDERIEVLGTKSGISDWAYIYYPKKNMYGWVSTQYIKYSSSEQLSTTKDINKTGSSVDAYLDLIDDLMRNSEYPEYQYVYIFLENAEEPILLFNKSGISAYYYKDGSVHPLKVKSNIDGEEYIDDFYWPWGEIYSNEEDLIFQRTSGAPATYGLWKLKFNGEGFDQEDLMTATMIIDSDNNITGYELYLKDSQSSTEISESEFDSLIEQYLSGYSLIEFYDGRYEE